MITFHAMSPFRHYWTRENIVTALIKLHRQLGHIPTVAEVRQASKDDPNTFPSFSTITREFETDKGKGGPWQKCLEACGFDTTYARRGRRPKNYKG